MLGERADLKPRRQQLRAECEALRDRLRASLPVHEEVDALDGLSILTTAIALKENLRELAGLNHKIGILERELGI